MANVVEGVDEALEAMRAEGHRAGHAEGYNSGRQHAAAILGHAEAKGREPLAAKLAATPGISPEQAAEMLAASPKAEDASPYLSKLKSDSPKLGDAPPVDDKEARLKELRDVTKAASAVRGR